MRLCGMVGAEELFVCEVVDLFELVERVFVDASDVDDDSLLDETWSRACVLLGVGGSDVDHGCFMNDTGLRDRFLSGVEGSDVDPGCFMKEKGCFGLVGYLLGVDRCGVLEFVCLSLLFMSIFALR